MILQHLYSFHFSVCLEIFCMFENTGADKSGHTIPVPIPTSSPTTKGATVKKPEAFTDLWIPKVKRGKSGKPGMAGKADSDRRGFSCPFLVVEKNGKGVCLRSIDSEEFSLLPFFSLPHQVLKTSPPNFLHSDVQGSRRKDDVTSKSPSALHTQYLCLSP